MRRLVSAVGSQRKRTQRAEGRILRIVNEVAPVAMLVRPAPGENDGTQVEL